MTTLHADAPEAKSPAPRPWGRSVRSALALIVLGIAILVAPDAGAMLDVGGLNHRQPFQRGARVSRGAVSVGLTTAVVCLRQGIALAVRAVRPVRRTGIIAVHVGPTALAHGACLRTEPRDLGPREAH